MTNEEAIKELSVLWERMNRAKESGVLAYKTIMYYDGQYVEALDMAIKALEQQPKTGHWEYVQYDYNPDIGNWHCSECRNIVIECANKNEKGGIPIYNFCPNCGAKMVESEDKE